MAGLEKKKFRQAERMCQNANMTRMVACNRSVRLVLICMDSWTRPGNNKKNGQLGSEMSPAFAIVSINRKSYLYINTETGAISESV